MDETAVIGLPLLQPAQAQKHVTMNEALSRIDALTQPILVSKVVQTPPAVVVAGAAYFVPTGAVNSWSTNVGKIAFGINGGWNYITPKAGWRFWVADEGHSAIFDGSAFVGGLVTRSPFGAGTRVGLIEVTHAIAAGAVSTTTLVVPSHTMVLGATARVTQAITGTLTSWQLGNAGGPDRFGSGLGLGLGSWAKGLLSVPLSYYSPVPLELAAVGGDFSGGTVRIALHYLELTLPN